MGDQPICICTLDWYMIAHTACRCGTMQCAQVVQRSLTCCCGFITFPPCVGLRLGFVHLTVVFGAPSGSGREEAVGCSMVTVWLAHFFLAFCALASAVPADCVAWTCFCVWAVRTHLVC